jgi:hypothetical protein
MAEMPAPKPRGRPKGSTDKKPRTKRTALARQCSELASNPSFPTISGFRPKIAQFSLTGIAKQKLEADESLLSWAFSGIDGSDDPFRHDWPHW